VIQKATAQAVLIGDQRQLGRASGFLCQYYRLMGDLDAAIPAGERALAIAEELDDVPLSIVTGGYLGPALTARGEHRRAVQILTANVDRLRDDLDNDVMGTIGIVSVFSRV
jgi:hypothetical protein